MFAQGASPIRRMAAVTNGEPPATPELEPEHPALDQRTKLIMIGLIALAVGLGIALAVIIAQPPTKDVIVTHTVTSTTKPTTTTTVVTTTIQTTTTQTKTETTKTVTDTTTAPAETSTVTTTVTAPTGGTGGG